MTVYVNKTRPDLAITIYDLRRVGDVLVGLSDDYKMDTISLTQAENYNLDQILSYMTYPVQ